MPCPPIRHRCLAQNPRRQHGPTALVILSLFLLPFLVQALAGAGGSFQRVPAGHAAAVGLEGLARRTNGVVAPGDAGGRVQTGPLC